MATTIMSGQNMVNNAKASGDFTKFGYWLEGIDVTHQNLDQFTPYLRGVSRLFMHKPPKFMVDFDARMVERFKKYLEAGNVNIDGINDVTVNFGEFEGGFNDQKFSVVTSASDDTESITVSMYELTGSPVRTFIDTWVSGVRDYRSGIAHYHGTTTPYGEINHTAEFVYVNLDPTATKCEYVAFFAHAFPARVPKAHLNYERGTRDGVQLDIEFRCTKYESPAINDVGAWYINNSRVHYNYLDFDPGILSKDDGSTNANPNSSQGGYRDTGTYDYGYEADGTLHKIDGVNQGMTGHGDQRYKTGASQPSV